MACALGAWVHACSPTYQVLSGAAAFDAGEGGADASEAGDPCPVLYVSPAGVDTGEGCAVDAPLRTLGNALAMAGSKEVHACRGIYAEGPLMVSSSAVLRGGYDCNTWQRASSFGALDALDPNETKLAMRSGATDDTTLLVAFNGTVDGGASDAGDAGDARSPADAGDAAPNMTSNASLVLDGFSVDAPSGGVRAYGMRAAGGAVRIDACRIRGGSAAGLSMAASASLGIYASNVALDIRRSVIAGGAGVNTASTGGQGSTGIWVTGGSVALRDSLVQSGIGLAPEQATAGVRFYDTTSVVVERTEVVMQWGALPATTAGNLQFGIFVTRCDDARLTQNYVHQDSSSVPRANTPTSVGAYGILANTVRSYLVLKNRVDSGTLNAPMSTVYLAGVQMAGISTGIIAENVVYVPGSGGASVATPFVGGISVYSPNVLVVANTLVAGQPMAGVTSTSLYGAIVGASDGINAGDAIVRGNLVVGTGSTLVPVIAVERCLPLVAHVVAQGNVGVGNVQDWVLSRGGVCSLHDVYTWGSVNGADSSIDNESVSAACGTNGGTCIATVLDGWSSLLGSDVIRARATTGTLALSPNVPCRIARKFDALPDSALTDIVGVTRTSRFSAGAWEQDTCVGP